MLRTHRWLVVLLTAALLISFTATVNAQGPATNGTLTPGQPASSQITGGQTLRYSYTVTQTSQVTIQAVSDAAQVSLSIGRDDAIIAAEANTGNQFTVALTAVLSAGTYIVEVSSVNNSSGLVILIVQKEIPVTVTALTPGTTVSGLVGDDAPLALYSFSGLGQPAYLYVDTFIDSRPVQRGVNLRVTNTGNREVVAQISSLWLGARFRIPAGNETYQIEVSHSGDVEIQPFTLCLSPVAAGTCETAGGVTAPATFTALPPVNEATPTSTVCTVTPSGNSGVNIRQSASINAIIYGVLPAGGSGTVLGISPDRQWYNIQHNNVNGWVALSVVNASGNCANVQSVNPPPVISPSPTPVPPTQTPIPSPIVVGPCLITVTAPTNVYTIPMATVDNLYDQVGTGGQLIPTGRLADNSWWKTNYGPSWIPTGTFGVTVVVTGNCNNLPIVTP